MESVWKHLHGSNYPIMCSRHITSNDHANAHCMLSVVEGCPSNEAANLLYRYALGFPSLNNQSLIVWCFTFVDCFVLFTSCARACCKVPLARLLSTIANLEVPQGYGDFNSIPSTLARPPHVGSRCHVAKFKLYPPPSLENNVSCTACCFGPMLVVLSRKRHEKHPF